MFDHHLLVCGESHVTDDLAVAGSVEEMVHLGAFQVTEEGGRGGDRRGRGSKSRGGNRD